MYIASEACVPRPIDDKVSTKIAENWLKSKRDMIGMYRRDMIGVKAFREISSGQSNYFSGQTQRHFDFNYAKRWRSRFFFQKFQLKNQNIDWISMHLRKKLNANLGFYCLKCLLFWTVLAPSICGKTLQLMKNMTNLKFKWIIWPWKTEHLITFRLTNLLKDPP